MSTLTPDTTLYGLSINDYNTLSQLGNTAIDEFLTTYFAQEPTGGVFYEMIGGSEYDLLLLLEELGEDVELEYGITLFSYLKSSWGVAGM